MTSRGNPETVVLDLIERDARAWPRSGLDHSRVADFIDLYSEGGARALPPLEVVVDQDGNALLCDGHHRLEALDQLGTEEALAFVTEVSAGQDPLEVAFERAVAASAASAKPLTRPEKRKAVVRLIRADASRSDREVARIACVSPTTVGKIRRELSTPESNGIADGDDAGDRYMATTGAKELARRAFRALERIREAKGLGIADRLLGDRTSERFAHVLADTFGDEALERAMEYRTWINGAIERLKEARAT
jgi:hypothetical protein